VQVVAEVMVTLLPQMQLVAEAAAGESIKKEYLELLIWVPPKQSPLERQELVGQPEPPQQTELPEEHRHFILIYREQAAVVGNLAQ
jgi:hypothetical protein